MTANTLRQLASIAPCATDKSTRRRIRQALNLPADAPVDHLLAEVRRIETTRRERAARKPRNLSDAWLAEIARRRRAHELDQRRARRATARVAACRAYIFRRLRQFGFRRDHTSDRSAYYRHHTSGLAVRVSDHDVPLTDKREDAMLAGGHTWADSPLSLNYARATNIEIGRWLITIKNAAKNMEVL